MTGITPDISEWCNFEFYDLVWYRPHGKLNEGQKAELALWIGVLHRVGSNLCYWILPKSGIVQSHKTVQHVTAEDYADKLIKARIEEFQQSIKERINDENHYIAVDNDGKLYLDDEPADSAFLDGVEPDYEDNEFPDAPLDDEDAGIDHYLHSELIFEEGGVARFSRVVERAKHPDGHKIGSPHCNPMFDTREYIVEFPDRSRERFTANNIALNLYAQCDSEGRMFRNFEEIINYCVTDKALKCDDRFRTAANRDRVPKKNLQGHKVCVQYRGGETEWLSLKLVKDSNPIEMAEYAVANGLQDNPAFSWWVRSVLKHRDWIISKVKSKYWKTTHMYGIRLPHSVEEALLLDKESGTDYWAKAIAKENKKVCVAWKAMQHLMPEQVWRGEAKELIGYQEIKCHMIFAVKMDFSW